MLDRECAEGGRQKEKGRRRTEKGEREAPRVWKEAGARDTGSSSFQGSLQEELYKGGHPDRSRGDETHFWYTDLTVEKF